MTTIQEETMSADYAARYASRASKAAKILAILQDHLGPDLSHLDCLDVGCASGAITEHLAPHFALTVGSDIDAETLATAQAEIQNETRLGAVKYVLADGGKLPAPDERFDVVICAQVYEHAPAQQALADEIFRVLRPGGVCFFSGPNRLAVMEEHYWLPFLSWLPQPLSDLYMQIFGKGDIYDILPRYPWESRRLWGRFAQIDYSVRMIREPERFSTGFALGRLAWVSRLPAPPLQALVILIANYNWILVKPS